MGLVCACVRKYLNLFNPLPVLFKTLLHGQKVRVFFSGHLNLGTAPETGLPLQEKKSVFQTVT